MYGGLCQCVCSYVADWIANLLWKVKLPSRFISRLFDILRMFLVLFVAGRRDGIQQQQHMQRRKGGKDERESFHHFWA